MVPDRRNGGYRRYVIAVVGCLIYLPWAALAQPPSGPHPRSPYSDSQQQAQNAASPPVAAPSKQEKPYTADYQRSCNNPDKHEDADLCQQWRSANAAEYVASWSWLQFIVGVIGSGVAGIAAIFTAWAAIAASKAARSADKAVEVTSDTAKRQLRAYLHVDKTILDGIAPHMHPVARVTVVNSGATPAKILFNNYCIGLYHYPKHGELVFKQDGSILSKSRVGNNQDMNGIATLQDALTIQNMDAIGKGSQVIFVFGRIIYEDIYGDKWELTYRLMSGAPFGKDPRMLAWCAEGNEERTYKSGGNDPA